MTRVLRILAPNPGPFTLDGTNTWIVGQRPSVVIDPGPDDAGHLLAVLEEAEPVAAILLTHRHPDHAPGVARLREAARAPAYAFRPEDGEEPMRDGDVLEAGATRIRVVHTPGHTGDHVCLFMDGQRFLFTGDAVLGRGTSIVDPPEGDMAEYVASLHRLRDLQPRVIYPGHGPVVFDAMTTLDEYVAHRAEREEQVLAALADGRRRTSEQMVPEIYAADVEPSMYPAAARSVLAHLIKLEREGRVHRTGGAEPRFEVTTPRACSRCGRPAAPGASLCNRCAVAALQERP